MTEPSTTNSVSIFGSIFSGLKKKKRGGTKSEIDFSSLNIQNIAD